jgi:hypothetical protein
VGRAGSFEPEGVIVGLVGARFKKEGKMESQHMIVSAKLSRREFGYGVEGAKHNPVAAANLQFFAALYSQPSPSAPRFYFPSYELTGAGSSTAWRTGLSSTSLRTRLALGFRSSVSWWRLTRALRKQGGWRMCLLWA